MTDRHIIKLYRDLDSAIANPTISIEKFDPALDEAELLEVNNAAFKGHPDQGDWTEEILQSRLREPWFDPAGLLLHREDGKIIAFCWTKIVDEIPDTGELFVVGVHPHHQRRHYGFNIALAGLQHLKSKNLKRAMLYVDEINYPALGLYKALGFGELGGN